MESKTQTRKTTNRKKATATADITVHNLTQGEREQLPISYDDKFFITLSAEKYIPYYDRKDDGFLRFMFARFISPTTGGCIHDKTFYTAGQGLFIQDKDEFPTEFDRRVNAQGHTVDDIIRKAADSYWQDGNAFIEVVRTEILGKRFVHLYHHHSMDCRFDKSEDGGYPTHVLISKQFRLGGIYTEKDKAIRLPVWTDMALTESEVWAPDPKRKGVFRTVIHIKNDLGGLEGYGLPSNFSGYDLARLEARSTKFNLDNFENNMFLGGILTIAGNLSDKEEQKLMKNLRRLYTGGGTYGRILPISSADGTLNGTKFEKFDMDQDGGFLELDKRVEEKIIGVNNWSKEIMDMKNQSGLGKGGSYLKSLFMMKHKTVILPAQQLLMFNFIEPLMKIIDEWKGTQFAKEPWYIKPVIPVSFEGDLDVNSLLTVNEGRAEIGKEPLEETDERGKMLISQVKGKQQAEKEEDEVDPKKEAKK